jgi:hypothetical protein
MDEWIGVRRPVASAVVKYRDPILAVLSRDEKPGRAVDK